MNIKGNSLQEDHSSPLLNTGNVSISKQPHAVAFSGQADSTHVCPEHARRVAQQLTKSSFLNLFPSRLISSASKLVAISMGKLASFPILAVVRVAALLRHTYCKAND